jgi:hypothetical protein
MTDAAKLDEIARLELAGLAHTHNHKTRDVEPSGATMSSARPVFALEPVRRPPRG